METQAPFHLSLIPVNGKGVGYPCRGADAGPPEGVEPIGRVSVPAAQQVEWKRPPTGV